MLPYLALILSREESLSCHACCHMGPQFLRSRRKNITFYVCLFGVYRPTRESFIHRRRHHYRWKAANFDLYSAPMAIEQWGFFSVPYLLWHGSSVYNGHLRGPMTHTPIAKRFAVELSRPVFTTWVCRGWDSNIKPSACGANALTDCK